MRTYHSPTLGDVTFTEAQYRKLLRRFSPDKELGREYEQSCICPKGDGVFNCSSCKPFGGTSLACLPYLAELTDPSVASGLSLRPTAITINGSLGFTSLATIRYFYLISNSG